MMPHWRKPPKRRRDQTDDDLKNLGIVVVIFIVITLMSILGTGGARDEPHPYYAPAWSSGR